MASFSHGYRKEVQVNFQIEVIDSEVVVEMQFQAEPKEGPQIPNSGGNSWNGGGQFPNQGNNPFQGQFPNQGNNWNGGGNGRFPNQGNNPFQGGNPGPQMNNNNPWSNNNRGGWNNNNGFGSCSSPMSSTFRDVALRMHNEFRSYVAVGLQARNGFYQGREIAPPASLMYQLQYDCDAEMYAYRHVSTCDQRASDQGSRPGWKENFNVFQSSSSDELAAIQNAISTWTGRLATEGLPSDMIFSNNNRVFGPQSGRLALARKIPSLSSVGSTAAVRPLRLCQHLTNSDQVTGFAAKCEWVFAF
ncbi:unnamed protein product [Nippostrongylus brasiliensis]|uniref:SCP domain-containing protein n=1 Tax=Nippostrongylus brasiliensis TaxID=27835 RepID=A0A0N4Y8K7_NIPBR|nr:unnamed protein product [Nippostrongylus brasiliensis]